MSSGIHSFAFQPAVIRARLSVYGLATLPAHRARPADDHSDRVGGLRAPYLAYHNLYRVEVGMLGTAFGLFVSSHSRVSSTSASVVSRRLRLVPDRARSIRAGVYCCPRGLVASGLACDLDIHPASALRLVAGVRRAAASDGGQALAWPLRCPKGWQKLAAQSGARRWAKRAGDHGLPGSASPRGSMPLSPPCGRLTP